MSKRKLVDPKDLFRQRQLERAVREQRVKDQKRILRERPELDRARLVLRVALGRLSRDGCPKTKQEAADLLAAIDAETFRLEVVT